MVRLIMGANGAGKTKQLIELIHASVDSESGSVVCIEPSRDMTYDISYNVRLRLAGRGEVPALAGPLQRGERGEVHRHRQRR